MCKWGYDYYACVKNRYGAKKIMSGFALFTQCNHTNKAKANKSGFSSSFRVSVRALGRVYLYNVMSLTWGKFVNCILIYILLKKISKKKKKSLEVATLILF